MSMPAAAPVSHATATAVITDNTAKSMPESTIAGAGTMLPGQIVVARIPTIIDGQLEMFKRRCLVLGFEAKPGSDKVTGVMLARFVTAKEKLFNPSLGLLLEKHDMSANGIIGLSRDVLLRTDRVDLMPLEPYFFGSKIRTEGYVQDRNTMLRIGDALLQGLSAENAEASRGPRARLEGSEIRQTVEPGMRPVFEKFPLGTIARRMTLLKRAGSDDYERAFLQANMQIVADSGRIGFEFREQARAEAGQSEHAPKEKAVRLEYLKPADVRKGKRRRWKEDSINQLVARVNAEVRRNREAAGLEAPRDPGHIRAAEIDAQIPSVPARMRARGYAPISAKSVFEIADNYEPILPKNVTRGDVLVIKIADIMNPHDKRAARRPCVVYNVYEDADSGQIVGFDFFPRTRVRAADFAETYTSEFPNLYNNRYWDGGRIVAQKIARVAVGPEHFHVSTERVRNLNPELLAEVIQKHETCKNAGDIMSPYGLAEIPANWCLRAIDETSASPVQRIQAERVFERRERHQAALATAPEPGDIILRKLFMNNELMDVPVLIWGVWQNTVTGLPAAFDCMRIQGEDDIVKAWRIDLGIAGDAGENLAADVSAVDLIYNTEKHFTAGEVPVVIGRVDDKTMEALDRARANALIQCRDRKGAYPEFLPFDWQRVSGCSYGFTADHLKSRKFAPDLLSYANPGNLRHHQGRDNNRRGLPPRKMKTKFKPKPKI